MAPGLGPPSGFLTGLLASTLAPLGSAENSAASMILVKPSYSLLETFQGVLC